MNPRIKKVKVEDEKVYLRKSNMFGWKVIHPIKNEDGSINWFNLFTGGSWWNLLFVAVLVLLIVLAIYEYYNNINTLLSCFDNPIALENCKRAFAPEQIIRLPTT